MVWGLAAGAGCGGSSEQVGLARGGPAIAQPPGWPAGLRGEFAATITARVDPGTWHLELSPGHYAAVSPDGSRHGGIAFASTSSLFLQNDASCPGAGLYYWTRSGRTLRLTKVTDTCIGRIFALTTAAWRFERRTGQ